MSKNSKQHVSQKELVRLRERELANGSKSLYLDIYRNGKREREFLKLYLIKEKDAIDREKNRQTLATARSIQAKRQITIQNGEYDFTKQFSLATPFLDYFEKMCKNKEGEKDRSLVWQCTLRYLKLYCDEHTTFKDITKEWVIGFKEFLDNVPKNNFRKNVNREKEQFVGLSENTENGYFNKVRSCVLDAYANRIIPYNPFVGVDGFKRPESEREYLTVEEVQKLIDTPCDYPGLKSAFLFSCFTGLRKSDIERLTWGKVVKFGEFDRIVFKQQKTLKQEYMDINPQARELMGERGGFNDKVFPGFRYSSWMLLELQLWVTKAGIPKHITFHSARHTFAVMMLTVGADIYTVSKLLGHRSVETTEIYVKVIDKKKQDAIRMIPNFHKPTDESAMSTGKHPGASTNESQQT